MHSPNRTEMGLIKCPNSRNDKEQNYEVVMMMSWAVLKDCIRVKTRKLSFHATERDSHMVQRKIWQASILLGSTQGTRVPVPAKEDDCNWEKKSPKMVVQETEQIHPEGVSFWDITFLLSLVSKQNQIVKRKQKHTTGI